MPNKDVPLPTLFGFYMDELQTYLDEINGNPMCLSNIVVAFILYVDDIVSTL